MKLFLPVLLAVASQAQSVWFEPNHGQVAGQTQWIGRAKGAYLYITGDEVVYANQKNVHMKLVGASKRIAVEGMEPTGGYSSYFTGRDDKTWFTGIPHYAKLRYKDVYPGIDMVYYGTGRNVEYDFVVHAGADAERIELAFSEAVKLDRGDLVVAGMRQHRPRVVQDGRAIAANYRITDAGHVQIALAGYDGSKELTVDPVLEFSTYFGGPGDDRISGVKIGEDGNVYLAGSTQSPASPTLNPFQQTNVVSLAPFLVKMSPDGKQILLFAVLGSGGWDWASAVAVDASGSVVLTGATRSPNFPLKNAFKSDYHSAYWTCFVTRIATDGRSLVHSSYLGGSFKENAYAMTMDAQGSVFIAGDTQSKDFLTKSAMQATFNGGYDDCFLSKVSASGVLVASTYFGSSGADACWSVGPSPDGTLVVGGQSNGSDFPTKNAIQTQPSVAGLTSVIFRLSSDLQTIRSSTFIGGSAYGFIRALAIDQAGNIYAGGAEGPNFQTTKDAIQPSTQSGGGSIIVKLDPSLQHLIYATYFGEGNTSQVLGLALDGKGFLYVAGSAGGPELPVKNPFQPWRGGGISQSDGFVAKLTVEGTLIYSTPLGGSGGDGCSSLALDSAGTVYVAGFTLSPDFPTKNAFQASPGGGIDGFLVKISDNTTPPVSSLKPSPPTMIFRYSQGGPLPGSQAAQVTGGAFVASSTASWLSITTAANSLAVSISPGTLAPGTYVSVVTLTPQSGSPATIDVTLRVLAATPVISSIEPSFVAVGAGDQNITVHGSAFSRDSQIIFNGIPWTITPLQFIDSSTLRLTVPQNYFSIKYNHTLAVQNPNADLSNSVSLSVGSPAPVFTAGSVANAASFASGPVAPGEIVTIFGTNLSGVVTFDDIPATMIYASATQMSATVPYGVLGPTTTLKVGTSAPVKLSVVPAAPGIFAAVPAGSGILTLYATGCGALTTDALPLCALPVGVTVNGVAAEVLYAGIAPGLPEGANQINVRVPDGVMSGPVRIVLSAGGIAGKEFNWTLP